MKEKAKSLSRLDRQANEFRASLFALVRVDGRELVADTRSSMLKGYLRIATENLVTHLAQVPQDLAAALSFCVCADRRLAANLQKKREEKIVEYKERLGRVLANPQAPERAALIVSSAFPKEGDVARMFNSMLESQEGRVLYAQIAGILAQAASDGRCGPYMHAASTSRIKE